MIQIDPYVYFDWSGNVGPTQKTAIAVRWSGKLLGPTSELYTFYISGNDQYQLWIDNE